MILHYSYKIQKRFKRDNTVALSGIVVVIVIVITMASWLGGSPAKVVYEPQGVTQALLLKKNVETKVEKVGQGFRLVRGGRPYYLKGGGGLQQFDQLRAAGGNSVRLWSADYAGPLMDEAHRQGLTVMLGLWLEEEGEHFSYYDPHLVQAQKRRIRQQVLRYRYHPALLMWNLGNEVELSTRSPRLFKAMNELVRMIHRLDPSHPVTISIAEVERAEQVQRLAPEVDVLSINCYGLLNTLPSLLRKSGWRGPYIVTEFGSRGYWESDSTAWKAPLEQTSAAKAQFMKTRYRRVIAADTTHCLGSYVFFWGAKYEFTPTWFSLFEPTGEKTELVDELHLLWRHQYPTNRSPHVTDLLLDGRPATAGLQLRAGHEYPAVVKATDPEGDTLTVRWEVLPEMPPGASNKQLITPLEPVLGCVVRSWGRQAIVRLPRQPGAYRLFVRVFDGHGSVGTANVPFLAKQEQL